ncbi:hypothetical protein [Flavobacterium sp.]|uniref:hypothetical protein n=1 Tax=Flavobacterium sp. TaxID=239 RepID=UPI0039191279
MTIIKELSKSDFAFVDEIPEVLQPDFHQFIVGHTMSNLDGRTITYDMKAYYKKLMHQGTYYSIHWKL